MSGYIEIELDNDGYPTDTTLNQISKFEGSYRELMKAVAVLFEGYGQCKNEGDLWRVSTGGWSGNEHIIYALQDNYRFWSTCWLLSKRGGYYEFKTIT